MIYKQEIDTPSYLCDVDDHLHTWAAVRLCQEVTEYHGNATGIGFQTLLAQNRAWVITHAYYNIYRMPDAFERIVLTTWSRGNNGLIANRDYRIATPQGEDLLTGTSCWPMIDMTTRRVLRLNELIANYENHPECATQYDKLPKLVLPDMTGAGVAMSRTASYAMLDHTQHVNNSEYIRMIFDFMHESGFRTSEPFSLDVSYAHESRLGDELQLTYAQVGGDHYIKIDNPRGNSIAAKIATIGN